ncbi:MAG TPA: cyclopropane-fatty-acyl-phospholipid synthase family protein [Rhizomicrobium sp.]|jgi:cyclopropane-fatty-acyl-phospholipid synthase|nr:cyclopropane-fatty-acyl-phospholipid synthase family protein [Rhizomicrobium sp.]
MLGRLLASIVKKGSLTLIAPGGGPRTFGSGAPEVAMRLHDRRAAVELALNPELKLGELYMDGRLTVENGDIADLLDLLMHNLSLASPRGVLKAERVWRWVTRRFAQLNYSSRARRNVAHHYDLSGKLYDLFLDRDRQYSCAYFSAPGETLEEAQVGKKRHIAAKLHLDTPDLRVLDIGSGWGGLALDLARDCGAKVLGVTLSQEQIALARSRAQNAGLAERCRFELVDYRALSGTFDRIVSVGMFEHVGVPYYRAFFDKLRALLADDGVALLHTIGRSDGPGVTSPWTAKYIFPGGYTPALSEVLPAIERAGLIVTDIEVLRLHYAETLKEWRRRFKAHRSAVAELYDERFCRMWEFYLAGAEMAFRHDGQVVYQIQLTKRIDTLPLTRDYMFESERTMRFAGTEAMPRQVRAA